MRKRVSIPVGSAAIFAILVGGAIAQGGRTAQIPESLRVPADQTLTLQVQATGVQIYVCSISKTDPTKLEWAFQAPAADLFDKDKKKIGTHYAGPTWELSDGSKVTGEVIAREDSPDANAIAWLLLKVKTASGEGLLRQAQSIQRVRTVGGKAPGASCEKASEGQEYRSSYQATYNFFSAPN